MRYFQNFKKVGSAVVVLAVVGCEVAPPSIQEAVRVEGKILSQDGKPLGNVAVNFQPLENGYSKTVEVASNGSFAVETQPGKYAYYFSPKPGAKTASPKMAKYLQASMDRTVNISQGQELEIRVD